MLNVKDACIRHEYPNRLVYCLSKLTIREARWINSAIPMDLCCKSGVECLVYTVNVCGSPGIEVGPKPDSYPSKCRLCGTKQAMRYLISIGNN